MTEPNSNRTHSLAPSVRFRSGNDGCGFLFDEASGAGFVLNQTAGVLAQAMLHGATHEQLTGALVQEFEVTIEVASEDVDDFLKALADSSVGMSGHE